MAWAWKRVSSSPRSPPDGRKRSSTSCSLASPEPLGVGRVGLRSKRSGGEHEGFDCVHRLCRPGVDASGRGGNRRSGVARRLGRRTHWLSRCGRAGDDVFARDAQTRGRARRSLDRYSPPPPDGDGAALALRDRAGTRAGGGRTSYRVSALAIGVVADDLDTACAPVAAMLAMFPQATAEYLAKGVVEPGSLVEAEKKGPMAVMKMWPRKAIAEIAFVATPGGVRETLASYAETGVDELALVLMGDPETHPGIIRQLAAASSS